MYKVCRTEQSFNRQLEMEKGLLRLMLRKNYEDISVSNLCEYLQIPRKAFYRHFDSKDGALYALIDHTLAEFFSIPLQEEISIGTAAGDLERYFAFWYEKKELLDALTRSSLSGILVARATSFTIQEGHFPQKFKRLPPKHQEFAMSFFVCGLMSMVLQWHQQDFQIPIEEMTQLAVGMFTSPLLNP